MGDNMTNFVGRQISGTYCARPFTGTIINQHSVWPGDIQFKINLDQPITVIDTTYTEIFIELFADSKNFVFI